MTIRNRSGKTLSEADIRQKTGVMVLARKHADNTLTFNPHPGTPVPSGDCLIAIGSADHLAELESLARA